MLVSGTCDSSSASTEKELSKIVDQVLDSFTSTSSKSGVALPDGSGNGTPWGDPVLCHRCANIIQDGKEACDLCGMFIDQLKQKDVFDNQDEGGINKG